MLDLQELVFWINYEIKCGNRVRASKLYRIFCKYARLQYPQRTENQLKNYDRYNWR